MRDKDNHVAGAVPGAAALRTQVNILGTWVDTMSREEVLELILAWCRARSQQYVVTPNLNACRLLPDGWPLVAASRLTRHPIKRRVTGSDIVIPLCKLLSKNGFSAFLLGSTPEVLESASQKIHSITDKQVIVGTYSPPFGFEHHKAQIDFINEQITRLKPHAVIVALGCPKQELWMASNVKHLPIGFAIGVGGTLDFIAGKQRRAPQIFQRAGLEWLWRGISNPMRLGKRYIADAANLPLLLFSHINRHIISRRNTVRQHQVAK
jgi:N-acetylglucosaminyldiphosphoundecaprenol N-acetyl-beta-D-mannosaminyltransferase